MKQLHIPYLRWFNTTLICISVVFLHSCNQADIVYKSESKSLPDRKTDLSALKLLTSEPTFKGKITQPSSNTPQILVPGRTTRSSLFTSLKSNTINVEGATLTVPAAAISEAVRLSVTGLLAGDLPPIPAEITNVTKNYPGYRFLPHGTLFRSEASIAMAFDKTLIPEGFTSDDVYTFYYDETDLKWKALDRDSVDDQTDQVISHTLHFTDMINGIIKVPESPATEGYTPTSMKDIKAADPSAEIALISPPTVTNEGDAQLSFALKIPDGRAGIKPSLAFQYSALGNNSWTGYGWDLSIPAVTVDAGWGVPRYDATKESETYLLSGAQLSPVAHRSEYINRTAEKRFYLRVEGEFSKIIRHGDKPSDYWWEVTSKEGETRFFGGLPETGLLESAIQKDVYGNIGYWALTQERDLHGNFVNYTYDRPAGSAQQLYISEIIYTGHNGVPGPYKIAFLRTDNANTYVRKDARIYARMGFIQRDIALLRRVNVLFNNEMIRSYTLSYTEGAFCKTMLEKITELDASGKEFYAHKFEYYDDVVYNSGYVPFKTERTIVLDDDKVKNAFLNPLNAFFDKVSALGGSGSIGGGAKLTLTVGPNSGALKDVTAGGGVGYNGSTGEELLSLVDINGDGMADKVYKRGDKVYYRPNIQSEKLYGNEYEISNLDNFGLSKTNGIAGGPEANPPFSYVSYERARNKTKTEIYFTDFNGDGLVDLAKKGTVYFNHIDTVTNHPVFEAISERTPNPIKGTSNIDPALLPDAAAEQAELSERFPLHDAVRMWMAPYNGSISIVAPVQLMADTSKTARGDKMKDGVIVSIQHENNVLWNQTIDTIHYELIHHPPLENIAVSKGQRIFFRVQSRFNGSYDKVSWDPEINYTSITDPQINTTAIRDVNGKKLVHFKASEDFVLKGAQSVILSKNGKIRLQSTFSKPVTTDSLKLEILKTDSLGFRSVVFAKTYSEAASTENIDFDTSFYRHDNLLFKVTSSTNIDWSSVDWDIYLKYISFADTALPVNNYDGRPMFEFKPVAEYTKMYNDPIRQKPPTIADTSFFISLGFDTASINLTPKSLEIRPIFNYDIFPPFGVNDTLVLSVKTKSHLVGKKTYLLQNNFITSPSPIDVNITLGDTLFFEYHCSNRKYISSLQNALVSVRYHVQIMREASVSYAIDPANEIFGHLYRGWGQFDYDGNGARANQAIILSELKFNDKSLTNNGNNVNDTSDLKGQHNPIGDIFNVAIPYVKLQGYMGVDEMVFIAGSSMSSSRLGLKDVYVPPYNFNGQGSALPALNKVTIETSNSFSGGLSGSAGSIIASYCTSDVYFETDMADMNGDGYPDLISENSIQYTGNLGTLQGSAVSHGLGPHRASAEAIGGSLGGSNVTAKCINSLITKTVKNEAKGTQKSQQNDQKSKDAEETAEISVGFSGSISENTDKNTQTWMDINGDGLPDKLWSNGDVSLNLGYTFASPENWGFSAIREGTSLDMGLGGSLGYSYKNRSITGGVGLSKTTNEATKAFLDVNADGLPDWVDHNQVRFNTGTGFSSPVTWQGLGAIDAGESVGENANFAFTISIPIWLVKICINPSGAISRGVSRNITQLSDMDGDGMPDVLYSEKEGELKLKSSTINRTNMLKTVYRPLGSNFTLDYTQTPGTYNHPGGTWALASVKLFDGLPGDGADTMLTTFEYENGFYDRHERKFYGFSKVKTHFHDTEKKNKIYRTIEQQYSNNRYYTKGLLLSETLFDEAGNPQTGTENAYLLQSVYTGNILPQTEEKSDSASIFVALAETRQHLYNGASSPKITTRVTYAYDILGNITGYTDFAAGNPKDKVDVSISYHQDSNNHLYAIPSKQTVSTQQGVMRQRETTINNFGDITQIRQYISDSESANFDMEYDEYGNLTKMTRPSNYHGERLYYTYQYDSVVHAFITKVSDAYGYQSTMAYQYKWGMPVESTDINNQKTQFTYDDCGRQATVTGPYELRNGKPYSVSFNYYPQAKVPYAQTLHYDSVYDANIETYTFADGLGRPVQVKKSALLFSNDQSTDKSGYIVSGKTLFDAFGRITRAYQPVFEDSLNPTTYNPAIDPVNPTIVTYNVLDKISQTTMPDGSETAHRYGIAYFNGRNTLADTLIDGLQHQSVTFRDIRNLEIAKTSKSSAGDVTTLFEFNAIGELLSVTDPKGNVTSSAYDKLGRRISVMHPDAGLTQFTYDAAGNVYKKITANLKTQISEKSVINYHFDRERLIEIVYPRSVQNRVNYTYGAPGAKHNRAGRIELMQDASGGQEFFYGPLGEVVKTIHTVQLGESDMRTWIWSATYDTWNRVQSMLYPDGEKVTYTYNRAGNLIKMDGEKLGRTYAYVSRAGYDKLENRVYLKYGNGSVTKYTFAPENQRLTQMEVLSNNKALLSNKYTYDNLNNILDITNSIKPDGNIGGAVSQAYTYDDLNRITHASGTFTGKSDSSTYDLSMQYDILGNILQKKQTHIQNGETQTATSYDFKYTYGNKNAALGVGAKKFTYNENGNQTSWEDTVTNDYRQIYWDEENRISMVSDNGYISRYVYGASGERVIKSHGGSQGVYINGAPIGVINHNDNNYTVYESPYFVFQNSRFTKHYYAGSTRIVSKIGNGNFENQYRLGVFEITAGGVNYINRQQQLSQGVKNYIDTLKIPPGPPTMKGIYADPLVAHKPYPDAGIPDTTVPRGWPKKPVFASAGGPPGAPIQWGDNITNDNVEAGCGYRGNGNVLEDLLYFYHTDHLGSATYITDIRGNISQFVSYMPFGETFAEQHTKWDSPYKFNAKEKDAETGLYYYGARYYDPKTSNWISPDPFAEKYSGISPYAFCANNPLLYVDPDGGQLVLSSNMSDVQKMAMLQNLQKLTDDVLVIKGNEIMLSSEAASTTGKKKNGTALIKEIINHSKTLTLYNAQMENRANSADPQSTVNVFFGASTGAKVFFDPGYIDKPLTKISDPLKRVDYVERPPEIALAHELIHGIRMMKGDTKFTWSHFFNKGLQIYRTSSWLPTMNLRDKEELETIGINIGRKYKYTENKIRKEQNLQDRAGY